MSKIKTKRSRSIAKENALPLRQQLRQLNINEIDNSRIVEFVILNECLPKYFDDIEKFQKYAYSATSSDVRPIIYEEILYIITHYPAWDRPYVQSDIESMLKEVCADAKVYLKLKKPIPLDIMAELIKLRVILLIKEDVYNETMSQKSTISQKQVSVSSCDTNTNLSDENVGSKESFTVSKDRSTKALAETNVLPYNAPADYVREYDSVDVFFTSCSIVLQEYIRTMNYRKSEVEKKQGTSEGFVPTLLDKDISFLKKTLYRTPWSIKHCQWLKVKPMKSTLSHPTRSNLLKERQSLNRKLLYIVLTGFYDPLLIIYLSNLGLRLSCILSVATKDDKPSDPTTPFDMKLSSLVSPFSVVPVYHYSLQRLYGKSKRPLKICDLNYDDMKAQLVYHFWNTLDELYVSHYEYLKDAICMMCPPVNVRGKFIAPQSNEYEMQSEAMYRNVSELLNRLPIFRNCHETYLNDLRIIDLGETPEYVPVHEMIYYNRVLNRAPPDCYTIDLTVEGLLEEVYKKNLEESGNVVCFEGAQAKQCIKKSDRFSQIKNITQKILNKCKFNYMPVNFSTFYQKYRSIIPLSRRTKHVKPKKFEIHQGDNLELIAKYYPKFGKRLRDKTLANLEKSPPCMLWKLYENIKGVLSAECKLNVNQFQTWSSLLGLSPEEVSERLEVYMFSLLKCSGDRRRSTPKCRIHRFFPEPEDLNKAIFIDRDENWKKNADPGKNVYEYNDEHYFQWQEHLSPSMLRQKLDRCYNFYKCMDYEYISFLDSIVVKFHNNCDHFGTTSQSWSKGIRSPVSLHDFFKSVIYEDTSWMRVLEQIHLPDLGDDVPVKSVAVMKQSSNPLQVLYDASDFPAVKFMSTMCTTMGDASLTMTPSQYIVKPCVGYDLDRRHEINCVSNTFHSLDGLKLTMEKKIQFKAKPAIILKAEADGQHFVLYLTPNQEYSFNIESSNGTRFVFCEPEFNRDVGTGKTLILKKPRSNVRNCYSIKEIETIKFNERQSLYKLHFLNETSLLNVLKEISPVDSFSSTETLRLLESQKSITFKSTTSMTDVRYKSIFSKEYMQVIRAIRKAKKATLPHFKIISTALHKYKYVKVAKSKIIICFADGERVLRYIPNLNIQKKIEISKCMLLKSKPDEIPRDKRNTYDSQISLPNGLQISSRPSVKSGVKYIVQSHTLESSSTSDEVSRIFAHGGYVQIRYRDGNVKMIGIHGRCIVGELPRKSGAMGKSKKKNTRKVEYSKSTEERAVYRYMRLQKKVCRKVYHYQRKFLHVLGKNYLRNNRKTHTDFDINNLKTSKNDWLSQDEVTLTENQFLSAINFHIPEDSLYDYYTLDNATTDSHSSINDDGELTTIYADGTRITSWFKIDQEMIVISTSEDEETGKLETDIDDYTCNFLIPRVDGWISVQIYYQFEHSRYATVAYLGKDETHVRLPGRLEYQTKSDGTFLINLKDEFYVRVNSEEIKLSTNYCKTCYECCETTIYVKHPDELEISDDDILLEAKDCFGKAFRVDFNGCCHRNDQLEPKPVKKCEAHRMDDTQKFFIFDRNFNGKMYWNDVKVRTKLNETKHNETLTVKQYLDELDNLRVYDFIKYYYVHYCDRFLMQYRCPNPAIFGQHSNKILLPVYTSKRRFRITPDYTRVLPLFALIQDLREKTPLGLPLPQFENIFHLEKYLHPKPAVTPSCSAETIHMKLPPIFAEVAVENFAKLMDKADKFKIDKIPSKANFEMDFESREDSPTYERESSTTCVPEYSLGKIVHPKILYHKILEHKKRKDSAQKHICAIDRMVFTQSSTLVPPAPMNSIATSIFQHVSKVPEVHEERILSDSEFIKPPPGRYSRTKKYHEHSSQTKLGEHELVEYVTVFKERMEWRKPSGFPESDSSVDLSIEDNKNVHVKKKTKDEQVYTITPFDLFLDERQSPIMEDVERIGPRKYSKKQHDKTLSGEDLLWERFDDHGNVIKKNELHKAESKHSKIITGVHAIESYNQMYDKFINMYKDIPKDMKRFTELHRNIVERQSARRTDVGDREPSPPMILPSVEIKLPLPKQALSVHDEECQKQPSEIVMSIKRSRNYKPEDGLHSKTLERLSNEVTRKTSKLKYVPSEIDKKVQSKFKKISNHKGSSQHVSYTGNKNNKELHSNIQSAHSDRLTFPKKRSVPQ